MQPLGIMTEACDEFEVGWGIDSSDQRLLIVTVKRDDIPLGRPLGISLDLARSLVVQLERTIAIAEAWKTG